MLESLRLIDFKSFVDETIPFSPVTYILGANAAGKSNVLDALLVLRQRPFHPPPKPMPGGLRQRPHDPWRGIRGGPSELARDGTDRFAIHDKWKLLEHPHGVCATVEHQLRCETKPVPRLLEENFIDDAGRPVAQRLAEGTSAASSSDGDAASSPEDPLEELMVGFSAETAFMRFVDIRPERMLSHDPNRGWHDDFVNWQPVLGSWLARRPWFRDAFTEWAARLCAPALHHVEVVETDGPGGAEVVLVEQDGRRISVSSMSEGDLRCLGILTVLLGGGKPGALCMEAPTAGLHPSRALPLTELFEMVGARVNQVIVTTHDASLLRWLDDESLGRVVLLARTPEHPGTVVRSLGELPGFFEAKHSLGLDEMLTTGWLEMAL